MEESKLAFDSMPGNHALIEIPHDESLSITGDITVEFWLYLREWTASWTDIVSKYCSDQNNEFCFRTKGADLGQWYYGDGSNAVSPAHWVPKEDINLNKWTHVACVRKIGDYGRIYFNGIPLRNKNWIDMPDAAATKSSIRVMSRADRFQNGKIRDLRIWNTARTEEQIQANMSRLIPENKEGLIGHWKLNEGNAVSANDSVGYNHGITYSMNDKIDFSAYDFIDFGCKKGGSMQLAQKIFAGGKGIGLDINLDSVKEAQSAGHEAAWFDVTRLSQYNDQVRFVIMSHFLEHLSGYRDAYKCLRAACAIAKDFVYIQQPYFDADAYLFSLGLKLYWSDWSGHPNRMTSLEFYCMLRDLLEEGLVKDFKIYSYGNITDSYNNCVHPIDTAINEHAWSKDVHPPKIHIVFNNNVFRELRVLISTNDAIAIKDMQNCFQYDKEIF